MRWHPLEAMESGLEAQTPGDFEQTIVPHLKSAYSLARWLVGDAHLAEDVMQDAALRALTYFDSYKGGSPRAWLLQIVRNVAFGTLAARKRGGMTSLDDPDTDDAGESWAMKIADPAESPEETLVRRESSKRLDEAMAALPPQLRECLVLHVVEELSYKEIAQVTCVPVGTVMSRLWRARQTLMRSERQGAGL